MHKCLQDQGNSAGNIPKCGKMSNHLKQQLILRGTAKISDVVDLLFYQVNFEAGFITDLCTGLSVQQST